ncbi:MAG: Glu/Leu/Phe/Val dehydrogenase dimerization domain-containing protein, partial [Erysipelothrix sp.]
MNEIAREILLKYPDETLFQNAVMDFVDSIEEHIEPDILKLLLFPERTIIFRVPWVDRHGRVQVNYGYRVQYNSALGPYKGGLRFDPSVDLDVMKFLAFEQTFKNALTGLCLGGAKGGSDFDPNDKTEMEIMMFCQSFMTELSKHIGSETDIPAGDIGVGKREIGYLFGQYKRLTNSFSPILTSKNIEHGGALARTEATGYGLVYIVDALLDHGHDSFEDKNVVISGS